MRKNECLVFISYATPDRGRVLPFYELLKSNGFQPWMDHFCLKPGQKWDFEIRRALDKATFVIFFVSKNSFDRRGYLQRELKFALDKIHEKLIDDIYLIPVRLDSEIQLPHQLSDIHFVEAEAENVGERIIDALSHQLERLGMDVAAVQEKGEIAWKPQFFEESWDGIPGYEVKLEYLEFESSRYKNISDVTDYLRGRLLPILFEHREGKLLPMPEIFNYGQEPFRRTNTYDAHCGQPIVVGRVMAIQYSMNWYGAGAMHPNHHFETYNFILEPLLLLSGLNQIFENSDAVFPKIQKLIRGALVSIQINDEQNGSGISLDVIDVARGTEDWRSLSSFILMEKGFQVWFPPYQVGCYALGHHVVFIAYEKVINLMRKEIVSALGIEHLTVAI